MSAVARGALGEVGNKQSRSLSGVSTQGEQPGKAPRLWHQQGTPGREPQGGEEVKGQERPRAHHIKPRKTKPLALTLSPV